MELFGDFWTAYSDSLLKFIGYIRATYPFPDDSHLAEETRFEEPGAH